MIKRSEFTKYSYQLETLSKLVLSPREQEVFYITQKEKTNKYNMIYPFYQYGEYVFNNKNAQYYIPGSSIKGAIAPNENINGLSVMMVDDIIIKDSTDVAVYTLQKVQHIEQKLSNKIKPIQLEKFFPNMGVEMLAARKIYQGKMMCANCPVEYLKKAQENTKKRLEKLSRKIEIVMKSNNMKSYTLYKLTKINERIKEIIQAKEIVGTYIILLGGYKGLALSGNFKKEVKNTGIYIDTNTNLPHGLVRISNINKG